MTGTQHAAAVQGVYLSRQLFIDAPLILAKVNIYKSSIHIWDNTSELKDSARLLHLRNSFLADICLPRWEITIDMKHQHK